MLNFASRQLMEFFTSALFGLSCGMLYDITAVIRGYFKGKKLICALIDVLFCITSAIALMAFLLLVTDGRLRWYVILGIILGFFIYKNTISGLFFSGVCSIINLSVKSLNFLTSPIYKVLEFLKRKKRGCEAENGKKKEKKT